jgi:hypothetical protein
VLVLAQAGGELNAGHRALGCVPAESSLKRRVAAVALVGAAGICFAGCGGTMSPRVTSPGAAPGTASRRAGQRGASGSTVSARSAPRLVARETQPAPRLVVLLAAAGSVGASFRPAVRWRGQTAVWIARLSSGLTVLSFNQRLVRLALHSGTVDAGGSGWPYGPAIIGGERRRLVAAFNGGFKLSVGAGGFMSGGRVASPLRDGLGSIVTYSDGQTAIGAWNTEVPQRGLAIQSVRQNLPLLIDHGRLAATIDCQSCWGATVGGAADVARSALGITADGHLMWAAGEGLSVAALGDALLAANVVRAVELDINPDWVAGYLYPHTVSGQPTNIIPVVPNQTGVAGFFLAPYSRDFFSILAR